MNIKVQFQLTEGEYYEATLVSRKKVKDWFRPLRIGGFVCSIAGMALLFAADRATWLPSALLAAFGFFVSIYPVAVHKDERKKRWEQYSVLGLITWEFSHDEINCSSTLSVSRIPWKAFSRCGHTTNLFLLYRDDAVHGIIPKRAFRDVAEQQEFMRLAAEHISKPTGGFPVIPL